MIYVYLAGPITGCTNEEAIDWREEFGTRLRSLGYQDVNPLRCEPITGETYQPQYDDIQFGTPEAIAAKNYVDVERSDVVLGYLPKAHTEAVGYPSVGTLAELNWAVEKRKTRILITDLEYVRENPVIKAVIPWRFPEHTGFVMALELIEGIYGVYK